MVRTDEKQFEVVIDRLIDYARNVKVSLQFFIQRLEADGDMMTWPSMIDCFTSLCAQINNLMRYIRENKINYLDNRVLLPLRLNPDRDEELAKLTEGRVQLVNHEMVPDYLRTKPDPELEEADKIYQSKANLIAPDVATKVVGSTNKISDGIAAHLRTSFAKVDSELSKQGVRPSFSQNETNELILAVSTGRGLSVSISQQRQMHAEGSNNQKTETTRQQTNPKQGVKAPELKTSIKPAT